MASTLAVSTLLRRWYCFFIILTEKTPSSKRSEGGGSSIKEYGQEVDGPLFEQNYRRYLEEGNQLIEGAFESIQQL